jgi:hypothetical protein
MPDIFLHCGACDTTRPSGQPCECVAHDPWIVVGTTTIDGTAADVVASIGGDWLDLSRMWEPRQIGGRWVRPVAAASLLGDTETQDAFTVMRMEIVRRQSEIDAEAARAKSAAFREFLDDLGPERMSEPTCPECGPHGNAGRVLMLESWVDCTTCLPPTEPCVGRDPRTGSGCDVGEDCTLCFPGGNGTGPGWREVLPTVADLSASLIANSASSEVAAESVRSFIKALTPPGPTLAIGDLVFDNEVEVKRGPTTREAMENMPRPFTSQVVWDGEVVLANGSIGLMRGGRLVSTRL